MSLTPYHRDDLVTLYHGDCIEVMRALPDSSVDAVVTDPPYDLTANKRGGSGEASMTLDNPYGRARIGGFMGKEWDGTGIAFEAATWREVYRVMKPGAHLLAFGGTRTWHRLACAIEDAGFEVRDSIAWMYGSGFPKSLDVSKAIDKGEGYWRGKAGEVESGNGAMTGPNYERTPKGDPITPEAARWQGWGTALKPAFEPIVVARRPLIGTVAQNVLAHGTGALNVDGCRVGTDGGGTNCTNRDSDGNCNGHDNAGRSTSGETVHGPETSGGRWPANVILDESQARALDAMSGVTSPKPERVGRKGGCNDNGTMTGYGDGDDVGRWPGDAGGGASRFFYTAKADSSERPRVRREGGSDNATTYGQMKVRECNVCGSRAKAAGGERDGKTWPTCGHEDWSWVEQQSTKEEWIAHPTVKPLDLMRYLVRLVTPPGGVVLEPFAGSGTTLEACIVEGFSCIGIEREADYIPLIMQRITKPIEVTLL